MLVYLNEQGSVGAKWWKFPSCTSNGLKTSICYFSLHIAHYSNTQTNCANFLAMLIIKLNNTFISNPYLCSCKSLIGTNISPCPRSIRPCSGATAGRANFSTMDKEPKALSLALGTYRKCFILFNPWVKI